MGYLVPICVPLGAQVLILADVATEDEDHRCAAKKTQCTWEHLWKRRLCVFNTGGQGGLEGVCDYSTKVLNGVGQYTPVQQEASDAP